MHVQETCNGKLLCTTLCLYLCYITSYPRNFAQTGPRRMFEGNQNMELVTKEQKSRQKNKRKESTQQSSGKQQ